MSINTYITKRIKNRISNNKYNIKYYYSNRNHYNSSRKIITNISNAKNMNKDNKIQCKFSDNYLTCQENRNNIKINKIIKNRESKTLVESYSIKEMTNKNRKSRDSYKNINEIKLFKDIKNQNIYKSKKSIHYKKINKSPFKANEFPLTDRKAKDQIELNLEKIELLSREIKKIKENLKKSVEKNSISSNSFKSKSKKKANNKEDQKYINCNNNNENVIKVYLANKTRNKTKKGKDQFSENFSSNDSYNPKLFNFAYTYRRKNNNARKKNQFKTLNKINVNNIGQKNLIDNYYKIQNNTRNYNKKKEKEYK